MTPNRVKLGRAVTLIKYLATLVSLIFLPKTLIVSATRGRRQIKIRLCLSAPVPKSLL